MKKMSLVAFAVALGLSGCAQDKPVTQKHSEVGVSQSSMSRTEIDKVVEQYTRQFINHQPALATSLKLPNSEYGDYQTKLPDYSVVGMQALQVDMNAAAQRLAAIQPAISNSDDLLHVKVNEVIARYYAGDKGFSAGYIDTWGGHLPYIVNQLSGPLLDIPNVLKDQHGIESEQDAKDYLARLNAFVEVTQQVASKVTADANKGVILPKVLFPNTLGYLDNFTAPHGAAHPLVTSFKEKLANINDITGKAAAEYVAQAIQIVEQKLYPEFKNVSAIMHALESKAPEKVGIWAQPNGEAFYQHEITYLADSDMSAEEIHKIGLAEVERISKRMDEILKQNGYSQGSVGERMKQLNEESRFLYADSDEGREALLSFLRGEIATILQKAPDYFSTIPPQPVEVKRIPQAVEAGAPGGYYNGPSLDGSRPGVFSINLKDMKAVPSFGMKTLTYHEAVPGHHFQIALNMLQTEIGLMRQNASFNGYIEGWALYSELLAYEMGMYKDDPFGDLGRLQAEAYRAARLVVDTGLHYKKWTRDQAITYFADATGTAMSDVVSAIDRYIAWPGQALGYKLGMLKLVELREHAKQQLGEKFDIKAFHDVILLKGARPLSLVEEDVNAWVESLTAA
ncbi:DUF885 domain-containing protein [Pseudoalteromonas peptidolytica]|uniref:DUF885 domain-containing protein n=1 Tax=Pseudoalteromonas peptidolytica F12-50-A1 TaxID=1315280 RepID=A0A8I0MUP5_9GAMM|nr:DUF885 domain-containing protein [Pseudoalteromonas peptidolytica]MBE0345610.1 hypothetical protein [Pseudoalteromonas peptidolytica F12-50-A1]NLR13544.1 DUF885 domain-containing protein [Pseudoalteromonas peptidolytica]GEK11876.1 Tat pathway signal protein [Pseudoalteromonas peptidolytica]